MSDFVVQFAASGWRQAAALYCCARVGLIVTMRNLVAAGTVVAILTSGNIGTSAASGATPGVTATTIRVGIPYVDVDAAPLRADGVNLDYGNVPDAINALIDNINAHGGVDGHKLVPYILAVNPVGTAPAATACTQLTEDDTVFVVVAPLQATCFLEHDTPVVA